jgi:UDPglucose 6-dehydrogenase
MKITVIGSGYVGLVSGVCFASLGHQVRCVDKDESKISALKFGIIPIFEPGLQELLDSALKTDKICFSTDLQESLNNSDVVFIAVGTPQGEDGSADLSYVLDAASGIARVADSYKLIIIKSTVPVGSNAEIKNLIKKINPQLQFSIASNPEFLREGAAIEDFMNPDRIIAGVEDEKSKKTFQQIYAKFPASKLIITDITTAELSKYASNSFLATKISFINEMADLCEVVGGDIKQLSHAVGLDSRIGTKFLNPGPGFGGSCFPKDIMAILHIAKKNNVSLSLLDCVIASNNWRKIKMVQKITAVLGGIISDKKIALLGLAFKANTDDIRYSPAITIARELLKSGAKVTAHDPQAIENSRRELSEFKNIEFCTTVYEAVKNCDLIVIATEWKIYSRLDWQKVKQFTGCRKIIDLRNLFEAAQIKNYGFEYFYLGKKMPL